MAQTGSSTERNAINNLWMSADVIAAPLLESLLPSAVPGYRGRMTTSAFHHELKVSEAVATYVSESGNSLLISIADLHNQPQMYKNFLTGGGLRQSSVGNSFGMAFHQASLQGSADYGLVLGQASGVVGMAQVSQPILFSVVSQASPQASPQLSPQASPQFSPHGSPQFSPQGSPQFSPQVSPQFSPQFSPQVSPQASPQFSPQASPQFSPQASPGRFSRALVTFSQPQLGNRPSFSAGEAPITESQASVQLQSSGIDLRHIFQIAQSSPFSLSQAAAYDGSYIRPYGVDTGHDVAGWDLWDSNTKIGTMILGINDRIGILIEGTNLTNPDALLEISKAIDFDEINKVIEAHTH